VIKEEFGLYFVLKRLEVQRTAYFRTEAVLGGQRYAA
jgi:hypothetical protein